MKKLTTKKVFAIFFEIIFLIISHLGMYYLGSHDVFITEDGEIYSQDLRASLKFETEYGGALMEGLHRFYASDDNDFWFEVFMKTPEYHKIDSLNNGDWEDFYYYTTPVMQYKH